MMVRVGLALIALVCLTATALAQAGRCAHCGMRIEASSPWNAGFTEADGEERFFDAPKCFFRKFLEARDARDGWVTEYYSAERRPARELFYVLGSDVRSRMGSDLVPVAERERAETFVRDHGGRVLRFEEVTLAIVLGLFRH